MRITLEPTAEGRAVRNADVHVTVASVHDDLSAREVLDMFRGAMIAYTFSPEAVDSALAEMAEEAEERAKA